MSGGGGGGSTFTPTPGQREETKINAQLWNYYQQYYRPLIQKYSEKVISPETEAAEKRDVAGKINAEIMRNVTPGMASVNPVETEKRLLGLAGAESKAQVAGQAGVRSRKIGETQNIINIGQGQEAQAQAGISALASQSIAAVEAEQERQMRESAAKQNMWGSLIGTGAGIGMGLLLKEGQPEPTPEQKYGSFRTINIDPNNPFSGPVTPYYG